MMNPQKLLQYGIEHIEEFGSFPGYKINRKKTKIILTFLLQQQEELIIRNTECAVFTKIFGFKFGRNCNGIMINSQASESIFKGQFMTWHFLNLG